MYFYVGAFALDEFAMNFYKIEAFIARCKFN